MALPVPLLSLIVAALGVIVPVKAFADDEVIVMPTKLSPDIRAPLDIVICPVPVVIAPVHSID